MTNIDKDILAKLPAWARGVSFPVSGKVDSLLAAGVKPTEPVPTGDAIDTSLRSGKFPREAAAMLALMSATVYRAPDGVRSVAENIGSDVRVFEYERTFAVGFRRGEFAYVVFRGTDPLSVRDCVTDFRLICVDDPPRHAGFLSAWRKVETAVRLWMASLDPSCQLVLSGHSLGGGIATVAAFDLAGDVDIAAVITFGCPRCGTRTFRKAYQPRPAQRGDDSPTLGAVTWRFVVGSDAVTSMPPPIRYRHVGHTVRLKDIAPANLPGIPPPPHSAFAEVTTLLDTDASTPLVGYFGPTASALIRLSAVILRGTSPALLLIARGVAVITSAGADHPCAGYTGVLRMTTPWELPAATPSLRWTRLFLLTYIFHVAELLMAGQHFNGAAVAAMTLAVFAIYFWPGTRWIAATLAALVTLDSGLHVFDSILTRSYSPGVVTSVLLFLPLGLSALKWGIRELPRPLFAGAITAGVLIYTALVALALTI